MKLKRSTSRICGMVEGTTRAGATAHRVVAEINLYQARRSMTGKVNV